MPEENVPLSNSPDQPGHSNAAKAAKIALEPPSAPQRRFVLATAALVAAGVALVVVVGYLYIVTPVSVPPPPPTPPPRVSSEWLFQQSVPDASGTSDRTDEWRAARSDHKIIAYSIARCVNVDVEAMSPETFSMLMLDLRPNGDHLWRWAADTHDTQSANQQQIRINGYEGAILALSDAISRARIAAATAGGSFYPSMFWFGWITVGVSALATMVVTLRSSMGSAAPGLMLGIGIAAVSFSTVATVLTGAKQFWDPTNAYMRNEGALLSLKQLHQDISLTFAGSWDEWCQSEGTDAAQSNRLARWRGTLVSLQAGTMTAPVIVQNQLATAAQAGSAEADEVGLRRPRSNPTPASETSSTPVAKQPQPTTEKK
jgi:hypothetical protein